MEVREIDNAGTIDGGGENVTLEGPAPDGRLVDDAEAVGLRDLSAERLSCRAAAADHAAKGHDGLLVAFADAEPDEAIHLDVLAGLGARLGDELRHRHGAVAYRRLLEQDELRVEASELAFDDLVEHVGRLARVLHLRSIDRLFLLDRFGWHVLPSNPLR